MRLVRNTARRLAMGVQIGALLASATTWAADPQLVINELMYHPIQSWPATQPYPNTNLTEYVELYNAGTTTLALANYRFDNGIDFTFTNGTLGAGSYLVVCEDLPSFTNAYRTVTNVFGQFSGGLNNGGERVTLSRLVAGQWVTEDTIEYRDDDSSDGTGSSLELVHPKFARLRDHFAWDWVRSTTLSGTPGRVNSVYNPSPLPVGGDVSQEPALPPAASAVKISARLTGRDGDALQSVLVEYRKDSMPQVAFTNTPMSDAGIGADSVAGDGVYSAFLPPATSNALVMAAGEMLEFKIRFSDSSGTRTIPATNRAEVAGTNNSYFVKFGEDTFSDAAYPGEYETFHILMSAVNKNLLQTRPLQSDDLIDATVVVNDRVFYNCGVRLRGGSSRNSLYGNYRIDLPNGEDLDGYTKINLNHQNALRQHIGMVVTARATDGHAFDSSLARVFLNAERKDPPSQGIYHRFETFGTKMMSRIYGVDQPVNMYSADGDFRIGYLQYVGESIASYQSLYYIDQVNPYTAWKEMVDLCRDLNAVETQYPTVLTNRVNIPYWGALFGAQAALDNAESGFLSPHDSYGDELRVAVNPANGRFDIYPWDYDAVIGSSALLWGYNAGVAAPTVRKFLFNRPIAPYYVGNVRDIITTVMSQENMSTLFDAMGSKMAGSKNTYLATITTQRNALVAQINTNLTVTGLAAGAPMLLVTSTGSPPRVIINLSGQAPQSYTDRVTVNGTNTSWNTRNNIWSMTNSITLSGDVHEVVVNAIHPLGNIIKSLSFMAVGQRTPTLASGTLGTNVTWSSSNGVYIVTNDVTISAGSLLTVQPGTVLLFGAGRKLIVNGTLDIRGTASAPVYLYPQGNVSPWTVQAGTGSSTTISNAVLSNGRVTAGSGATLRLYDSTFSGSQDTNGIIDADGAAVVHMSRCIVRDFNRTSFNTSPTLIENSLLENMTAVGIEFSGATSTASVSRTTLRNPLGTDGISFLNSTAGLVSNVLVQGMSGTGIVSRTSTVKVVASVIDACGTGLYADGASSVVARNNTIVNSSVGITGAPAVTNSILWINGASFVNGPAAAGFSDIQLPGTGIYAGTGNLNRDPFFRAVADRDYQLQAISPCIGSGLGGVTMGASYPVGANPIAPTNLVLTPSSNSVALAWSDLSADETGFEVYRSNGGNTYNLVATTPANQAGYLDIGLGQDNSYFYRVRAVHARGASTYTDVATTRTLFQDMTQLLRDNLRITEIMYHTTNSNELGEFLEFKNISTNVVLALSGLYTDHDTGTAPYRYVFTNGTVLGPQQFFVLVRNAAAFTAAHPGVPISGVFTEDDDLSSNEEELWVKDATGTDILRFDYHDNWYPTTDGPGYTLVPVEPNPFLGDPDDAIFWRASSAKGGSPNANDPAPLGSGLVINEVLAHTDEPLQDAIEVRNIGGTPVSPAGWYLSDTANDLTRYQVPPGAPAIGPGAYATIYASQFSNSFLISEFGDEDIILSAAVGGDLTGYRSTFEFDGAVENGVSHGRYVRSDGGIDTTAMSSRSLGTNNPAPSVGPVVINEIMYNPGEGGNEYVELLNITSSNIPLFDVNFPSNTWRFNGSMEYVFPLNTTLAANELVLISSIDPALFRQQFGIAPGIRIFGPFIGALANNDDSVKLYKPGTPEELDPFPGFVPQIIEDRVHYNDRAPWPTLADNGGASLERRAPAAYGNDPTNWIAVSIGGTPGQTNNLAGFPSVGFPDVSRSRIETNEIVAIEVTLLPSATTTVTVNYAVSGGTAVSGNDFTLPAGTLTFWPHETSKFINLAILNDAIAGGEPNETVVITLTNVSANALLGGNRVFTHTIVDNDATTMPPPVIVPNNTTDFTNFVKVTMIAPSSVTGAVVRFTTDGTRPTEDDTLYTQPIFLTASARVTARMFLGDINAGASTSVLFRAQAFTNPPPPPPTNTIDVAVSIGTDDGFQENFQNRVQTGNPSIFLAAAAQKAALFRFQNVGIPRDVTVTNAYIQFTSDAINSGATALKVYAQAADDTATLVAGLNANITLRPRTTASVPWNPTAWNVSERGDNQRTPNLSALLNEVIGRAGWQSNNSMAIIIIYTNSADTRAVRTFDGNPDQAALLHAEFIEPLPTFYLAALTNGNGSVSGGNLEVEAGSNATIIAQANFGYVFAGWSGQTGNGDTNSLQLTILMDQDRTVTANFVVEPPSAYYLTVNTNGNGSVSGGNLFVPTGSNATITAQADLGNSFAGWSGDTGDGDTNSVQLTVVMDQDRTVIANFLVDPPSAYFLTVNTNGNGSVSGGNLFVPAGSNATVIALADPDSTFAGWSGDTGNGDTNEIELTVLMNQDRTVAANFELLPPPPPPLKVLAMAYSVSNGLTLYWLSETGLLYSVYRTTNLVIEWPGLTLESDIPGSVTGTNSYSDTNMPVPAGFYSIDARSP